MVSCRVGIKSAISKFNNIGDVHWILRQNFSIKEVYYYVNRVGFKIKQIMKDEDIYKDRASQIQAIDKTFEQAKEKVSEFVKVIVLDIIPEYHILTKSFSEC